MRERPRALTWVKGHSGVGGNEEADRRAGMEVEMGQRMQKTVIATPGGIKKEFPIFFLFYFDVLCVGTMGWLEKLSVGPMTKGNENGLFYWVSSGLSSNVIYICWGTWEGNQTGTNSRVCKALV